MKIPLRVLLLLIIPPSVICAAAPDERIQATLESLDAVFDSSFDWWGKVYDPASGGCFYSLSAKSAAASDPRFGPDIESLSKLVSVLHWCGELEGCSPAFKSGVIAHLQGRQDPESGLFRDPQHKEQYTHNTLLRVTSMAMNTLKRCAGKACYPSPMERTDDNTEAAENFAHLDSPEAMDAWLKDLPWDTRIWTVGWRIRAQLDFVREIPESQRSVLLDTVEQFVRKRQRPDGFFGMEGAEDWGPQLSGTYKIAAFLYLSGRDIPREVELTHTVLRLFHNETFTNTIILYNAVNLLKLLHQSGPGFSIEERIRIVERATELLKTMKAPDGGFVTHTYRPTPVEMGKLLGKEVVESNSNSTGLAHSTRSLLIELLTGEGPPHPHPGCVIFGKELNPSTDTLVEIGDS